MAGKRYAGRSKTKGAVAKRRAGVKGTAKVEATPAAVPETIIPTPPHPTPSSPPVEVAPEAPVEPVVELPPAVPVTPAPIHAQAQVEMAPIAAPAPEPAPEPEAQPAQAPPPIPVQAQPAPKPALLFEIAWEVCWQLGGIYTVLKTKAQTMVDGWGDRYCLIGPLNPASAEVEFEDQTPDPLIKETLERLRHIGVLARYGRWLVPGRPRTILIDHRSRYGRLHEDKYLMWKDHSISTDASDGEVNDVVAFGFGVAEFFRELTSLSQNQPILAHFHEWMGAVAVPRIAHLRLPMATVFTTHATLLGRYLASDNPYFYSHLPFVDPDKEAAHFNIYPRFAIERAAAHASTVFTTVSEVTAVEAARLLGRQAEVILPNGLNIQRFTAVHEFQNMHREYKERIHDFVMGHFFPAYEFDLDNTLYFFTSGRYEYRNKGMDIFIEAMVRLNWRLKSDRYHQPETAGKIPTIVAFVITRAQTRNMNVGVLQSQTMFEELKQTCERIQEGIGPALLNASARGKFPGLHELFSEDARILWKRAVAAWKNKRQPTIITHDLADEGTDPVLKHIRHRGLFNAADDPVKIVYHPDFVSATSPLLHLDYDQFVRGCHMGIFPSYYEPWGYTPMEAVASGVPAVTSDLSGYGAYVQRHIPDHDSQGIFVSHRRDRSFDDACNELVEFLYQFTKKTRRERIEYRNKVERLGELFDWSALVKHYDEAHELALSRIGAPVVEVRMV